MGLGVCVEPNSPSVRPLNELSIISLRSLNCCARVPTPAGMLSPGPGCGAGDKIRPHRNNNSRKRLIGMEWNGRPEIILKVTRTELINPNERA